MSTINWAQFFPPGSEVLALPSWKKARLFVPAQSPTQRWRGSNFYPAVRSVARLYRSLLRTKATLGLVEKHIARVESWELGAYLADVLPQVDLVVVRPDRNDPSRKATIQLWEAGYIVGYLKYAEGDVIDTRLRNEYHILSALPEGFGPTLLKYGSLGEGEALLTAPLLGKTLPPKLPPPESVVQFLRSLPTLHPGLPVHAHPWVQSLKQRSTIAIDPWIECIEGKEWAVVTQHGDAVPWNMLHERGGDRIRAVDWEYGTLAGLPVLDLIHYILHTAALVYRWPPPRALEYAIRYLTTGSQWTTLEDEEARALTCIAAYSDYRRVIDVAETTPHAPFLQNWRRNLWDNVV